MPFAKLNAVGHHCHLTQTPDGRVLVQSRATGAMMQDGVYSGRGPFKVVRSASSRDVVIVGKETEETSTDLISRIYYELTSNDDLTFTTTTPEPLPVDLPMDVPVEIDFSVFFALWISADPPPIGSANPMFQLADFTPFYVIEHFSTAPTSEELASGFITPPSPLDQAVTISWADTITIEADSVDPTGTLPIDTVRVTVYTDDTRAVEIFHMDSAALWP